MALKRRITEGTADVPQKRSKPVGAEEAPQDGWQSDDSGEYAVNFTVDGTLRADSEARRNWNYVCTVEGCEQRFNRPCRLEAHMRSHNKERPFVCSEPGCDKSFPRKDHLQRHLKNAHNDPATERTYACDWQGCGKSFTSNGRLQRHRDVHNSKFYCTAYPPCDEAFRKQKALDAHIKMQHLEVKPYPCTYVDAESGAICENGYQTESALQRHVHKTHSIKRATELFCMICADPGPGLDASQTETDQPPSRTIQPPVFETHEELAAHVKECHPPECSECGQRFKNDSTLKSHVDTVHASPSQQRQYPCPKPNCNSIFNRKHNLTVHIHSVHENQPRYFCLSDALQKSKHEDLRKWNGQNACGAAFKAKSSLDQHVRTHHLNLGTRKQLRKAAKSKKKPEPSMLSMLTGVGYEQNREVPCLFGTCQFRFYMDRDLRRHLRAAHDISDDDIEEMMRERDALTGGHFWIGGLDDASMGMFDSVEPSMPQTPMPYFAEGNVPMPMSMSTAQGLKGGNASVGFFDRQFDELSLLNEEAEMDAAMGLGGLAPATDVQEGLQWDMLAPVERYNMTEGH